MGERSYAVLRRDFQSLPLGPLRPLSRTQKWLAHFGGSTIFRRLSTVPSVDPAAFKHEVAALYSRFSTSVRCDVSLAGSRVDIVVVAPDGANQQVTKVVACKAFSVPVGVRQVRMFSRVSRLLRDRQLADAAAFVSAKGFTSEARRLGEVLGIELLTLADLQNHATHAVRLAVPRAAPAVGVPEPSRTDGQPERRAFIAIPFTPHYDDVHLYGIRAAAEKLGITVERADDSLDSTDIITYIKSRIKACDLLIADTTELNANVFYELGYADGIDKAVLLIAAANTELPFDIRGRNHLLYANLAELESKLGERLRGFFDRV